MCFVGVWWACVFEYGAWSAAVAPCVYELGVWAVCDAFGVVAFVAGFLDEFVVWAFVV